VRLEVLGKFKKSNNRDLPACSIVFQPTKLSRASQGSNSNDDDEDDNDDD
jgi:hypothetical protein